jgi:hypothetical protein
MHPLQQFERLHLNHNKERNTRNYLKNIMKLSPFNYCKFICRSNSLSVQNENTYRGHYKHCFKDAVQPPIEILPVNSDFKGFIL